MKQMNSLGINGLSQSVKDPKLEGFASKFCAADNYIMECEGGRATRSVGEATSHDREWCTVPLYTEKKNVRKQPCAYLQQ